jgi:hypothetical protein
MARELVEKSAGVLDHVRVLDRVLEAPRGRALLQEYRAARNRRDVAAG